MVGGMKDCHRQVLLKSRIFLSNNMEPDEVLEHLVEKEILTNVMYARIKAFPVQYDQNIALLTMLPKRGPKAFSEFCNVLRETGQKYLAEELENKLCSLDTPEKTLPYPVHETGVRRMLWTESPDYSIDDGDGPIVVSFCSVDFYLSHHNEDMLCKLDTFSKLSEHADLDSCIVALLSHGVDGAVYGTDGQLVQLQDVFRILDNAHCPHLQNKPKMFFIQACRGEETDRGVDQQDGREQSASPGCEEMDAGKESVKVKLPKQSDMICAYACLKGTVSLRNTKRGSWFVEALISVFSQHAKNTHVADMLVKVNALIKEREGHAPGTEFHRCKEMSEYSSTLCRNLYLFPGIPGL
ncbi:caspase-2 isoform X2 [Pelobates cultripes]|uniref:Caspase-2 isoform X2 n=1 Tax=Pelobates cultripes TaxID=61616 RepID=A0AAD1TEL9_PELCU|nr:caspase-2 isoform X2 [Pelobates cultripes]